MPVGQNPYAGADASIYLPTNPFQFNGFMDKSKATSDIQRLNFDVINNALRDFRQGVTKNSNTLMQGPNGMVNLGQQMMWKDPKNAGVTEDQQNLVKMFNSGQRGTQWKDLLGKMRNQYMDRYEGEQKGEQAQLERMRKLGLAAAAPPTPNTPAGQREGALTSALQNGGGTSPMMYKGREVMSPFADRMRNYTQQQQQPTQQQPQTQGAVYGGFGQSPLTQALQSGGQAQVTSNRYRPITNWGAGGFRSALSGF
jgi:hypothetical protein